jgi:hypothetical protein
MFMHNTKSYIVLINEFFVRRSFNTDINMNSLFFQKPYYFYARMY